MSKHIHIVIHDVPFPADYGGVIDPYYKLKWLHEAGIKITLHCFVKDRRPQAGLEKYCESVHYYARKKWTGISLKLPYIVSSRVSDELVKNLQKDDHPVLLEGIHSTAAVYFDQLTRRKIFLRLYNVEHDYYAHLAKYERSFLKRLYFLNESRLLKKYEAIIAKKIPVWTLSKNDAEQYKTLFGAKTHFLPAFLPWDEISGKQGKGSYCLYQANLAVNENEKAATWLIMEVFSKIAVPFIIAGHNPAPALVALADKYGNVKLIPEPAENEMQKLISNAQVNILPSFNNTGVKLKLLNALFNGRHCIVNDAGAAGSGVEGLCSIANTPEEFILKIQELFSLGFSAEKMQHRSAALKILYNNEENTRRLIAWLW